ncbi:hypothetical protein GCM10009730_32550 [Streptomyces albidochromogenes]
MRREPPVHGQWRAKGGALHHSLTRESDLSAPPIRPAPRQPPLLLGKLPRLSHFSISGPTARRYLEVKGRGIGFPLPGAHGVRHVEGAAGTAQSTAECVDDGDVQGVRQDEAVVEVPTRGRVGVGGLVPEASVFGAEGVGLGEGRAQFFLDGLSLRSWCTGRPRLASAADVLRKAAGHRLTWWQRDPESPGRTVGERLRGGQRQA